MIVVGLDLESTGLDIVNDRPIEVGLALWSTKYSRVLESRGLLIQSDGVRVPEEATEVNGVTQGMADGAGYSPADAFEEVISFVERAEAIVAFNGDHFDIPMMNAWAKRLGTVFPDKQLINPYVDMPKTSKWATPGMRSQELIAMCAKHGIYYNAHEALGDVTAMLRLMAERPFDLVWQRATSPTVIIQSYQGRHENAKAKKHKFRWNPERKIWWKAVKQIDLDNLATQVNNEFSMRERPDLSLEELDTQE